MAMQTPDHDRHDVVVVGGRVAGSATAMLLARLGHDVAVVDQASFPSDTVSLGNDAWSTTATSCPSRASSMAVAAPATRAPTITTS